MEQSTGFHFDLLLFGGVLPNYLLASPLQLLPPDKNTRPNLDGGRAM
jgi:hypothetical protein